jgi:hypothetical protein
MRVSRGSAPSAAGNCEPRNAYFHNGACVSAGAVLKGEGSWPPAWWAGLQKGES